MYIADAISKAYETQIYFLRLYYLFYIITCKLNFIINTHIYTIHIFFIRYYICKPDRI